MEKAVYRIEQELKRSKTQHVQSEDDRNPYHLQSLLNEAQGLLPRDTQSTAEVSFLNGPEANNATTQIRITLFLLPQIVPMTLHLIIPT